MFLCNQTGPVLINSLCSLHLTVLLPQPPRAEISSVKSPPRHAADMCPLSWRPCLPLSGTVDMHSHALGGWRGSEPFAGSPEMENVPFLHRREEDVLGFQMLLAQSWEASGGRHMYPGTGPQSLVTGTTRTRVPGEVDPTKDVGISRPEQSSGGDGGPFLRSTGLRNSHSPGSIPQTLCMPSPHSSPSWRNTGLRGSTPTPASF